MDLAPIIAQLKAKATSLKYVGGSANFQTLKSNAVVKTPAAFVIPVSETPLPNNSAGAVMQVVNERFGIVIWIKDVSDATGSSAYDGGLATAKAEIISALLGWAPDASRMMCTEANGRAIAYGNGSLWWQQDFITSRIDRSA